VFVRVLARGDEDEVVDQDENDGEALRPAA
jgi:hypothetical protein